LSRPDAAIDACIVNEEIVATPYVVNIVDVAAHREFVASRNNTLGIPSKAAEIFYRYFPDEFDFLQFHAPGASASQYGARFKTVKRPALKELGIDSPIDDSLFYSTNKLKGIVLASDSLSAKTATLHELFHYNDCQGFLQSNGFPYDEIGHCTGVDATGKNGTLFTGPFSAFAGDFYTPLGDWKCADRMDRYTVATV